MQARLVAHVILRLRTAVAHVVFFYPTHVHVNASVNHFNLRHIDCEKIGLRDFFFHLR